MLSSRLIEMPSKPVVNSIEVLLYRFETMDSVVQRKRAAPVTEPTKAARAVGQRFGSVRTRCCARLGEGNQGGNLSAYPAPRARQYTRTGQSSGNRSCAKPAAARRCFNRAGASSFGGRPLQHSANRRRARRATATSAKQPLFGKSSERCRNAPRQARHLRPC
jgi:hypothetical protein